MAPARSHFWLAGYTIFSMNNYFEVTITANESIQEMLVAELSETGYTGFEESATHLKAYIAEEDFKEDEIQTIVNRYAVAYTLTTINKQNWNALWESNFEPVQVDHFVGIRASFHPSFTDVKYEIVITPKMSFGTGHHATTYMVMKLMEALDFDNKSVFDFGSGTGILAILAEKLGAKQIVAVDNDDWCIENATENVQINQCRHIQINKVDKMPTDETYDIILANINRNIILDNIHELKSSLKPNAQLLLSGLLEEDEADIVKECNTLGLTHKKTLHRNGWIALWFF